MSSRQKWKRDLREAVEAMGFRCLDITTQRRTSHYKVRVRDDAGNRFNVFAAGTPGGALYRAIRNFQSDVRRQSNVEKGLIE